MAPRLPPANLANAARDSYFHPDDPPYLCQAWRAYIDQARSDREACEASGKKKIRYSWTTELAYRRYWDAVRYAREEGYVCFERLDLNSPRPTCLDGDDEPA